MLRHASAYPNGHLDEGLFGTIFDASLGPSRYGLAKTTLLLAELSGLSEELDLVPGRLSEQVLQQVVEQMRRLLPVQSMITRLGRDIFALAVPSTLSVKQAIGFSQQLTADPLKISIPGLADASFAVAAGVAIAPYHGETFAMVLANAELALIELRRDDRAGFRMYQPHFRQVASDRSALRRELVSAYREQQFELAYQPQVCLETGEIVGCEALLRWRHPARGTLLPAAFLAELESMPLAVDVERWVIDTAMAQAARWLRQATPIRVSANLFPRRLSPELVKNLKVALERHRLPPAWFEIEVTERHAMADLASARATLEAVRTLGVSVALDDFGTGFATFTAMRALEVDRIKIDRCFVKGLADSHKDQAIVAGLSTLVQRIGISLVAEGIETGSQRDLLRFADCDLGQGAFFGMPMPAVSIGKVLRNAVQQRAAASGDEILTHHSACES